MTTQYKSHGVDLDDIFDPYLAGPKPSPTGYQVAGVDLRDRYNPLSEGDAAPITGFQTHGVDLNQIFAAKGTSTQALVIPFGIYGAAGSGSHNASALFGLSLSPDGTWTVGMSATPPPGSTSGAPTSGSWHRSPATAVGSGYEVRFTAAITVSSTGTAGQGTFTGTTGWLTLSVAQGVQAATDHITGGGSAEHGSSNVDGFWYVDIRKVGSTLYKRSTCNIHLQAMAA